MSRGIFTLLIYFTALLSGGVQTVAGAEESGMAPAPAKDGVRRGTAFILPSVRDAKLAVPARVPPPPMALLTSNGEFGISVPSTLLPDIQVEKTRRTFLPTRSRKRFPSPSRGRGNNSASLPKTSPAPKLTTGLALLAARRVLTIPKTSVALLAQVGTGFRVARRGSFLLASDLGAKDFSILLDSILSCATDALGRDYFGKLSPHDTVTIYVFRNAETYRFGMRRLFDMAPISPYGHYGHSQRYIVINYDTGPGTLVHELTHALMARDFPTAPVWLSEGIASLYEQCRVEGKSLKGDPNWRLPELKAALRQGRLPGLTDLFAMSPIRFRQNEESLHYAVSRYFCRYLEGKNQLRLLYASFRDQSEATGSVDVVPIIEKLLGKPFPQVEDDWQRWLETETWKPKEYPHL